MLGKPSDPISQEKGISKECQTRRSRVEVEIPIRTNGASTPSHLQVPDQSSISISYGDNEGDSQSNAPTSEPPKCIARDRSWRVFISPRRYAKTDFMAYAFSAAVEIDSVEEPSTYDEAIISLDSEKWIVTMNDRIPFLFGKKPVRCKCV